MRILKRILMLFAALIMTLSISGLVFTAKAADAYVIDEAGKLSQSEIASLNAMAEEITNRQECGVYVIITDDLHGYRESQFAQGLFMNYDLGYGSGEGASGVLLAISYEDSFFDTVAYGAASGTFTTSALDSLNDTVYENLAGGDWYGACEDFLKEADRMLTNSGYTYYIPTYTDPPINQHTVVTSPEQRRNQWLGRLPFAGIAGAVISSISVFVMKGKNKNTKLATNADRYIVKNGVRLTVSNDRFINKTRSVTTIPRNTGGGGGGGGSSHSYHSSGFSHSSGGRHF